VVLKNMEVKGKSLAEKEVVWLMECGLEIDYI
jgi:hypothetical protein